MCAVVYIVKKYLHYKNMFLEGFHTNRNCKLEISTAPQKQSHGNKLIHRRLSKIKSIGSVSDPESQADSQMTMVDGFWS